MRKPPNTLTVLICTHNRADLLAKVIASLNGARRPEGWEVCLWFRGIPCSARTSESPVRAAGSRAVT